MIDGSKRGPVMAYAWPVHAADSSMFCSPSEASTICGDIFSVFMLESCIHTRWELDKRKLSLCGHVKIQK